VHFQMIPHPKRFYFSEDIVRAFEFMRRAIEAGRLIRDRATLTVKYPLRELVVICKTAHALQDIKSLEEYIKNELNVQCVTVSVDESDYNVRLTALPDSKALGKKLGDSFKQIAVGVQKLSHDELVAAREAGKVTVCGQEISVNELLITYSVDKSATTNFSAHADGDMIMLLDLTVTQEMIDEGVSREFVNRVQRLRKKGGLQPLDRITVVYKVTDDDEETHLDKVIKDFSSKLSEALDGQPIVEGPPGDESKVICKEETSIKSADLLLWLLRRD
jgi:isoleucyl-tRNA synthetase